MRARAAFATVTAALACAALAAPARAETGCEGAEALRDARLLEQAQAEYEAVAGTSPAPACAKDVGTVKIARKRAAAELSRAKRLETANDDAEAREAYADAAGRDASLAAATDGLSAIVAAGGGEPCDDALALRRARLLEEAEARAKDGDCTDSALTGIAGERAKAADYVTEAGTLEKAGEFAAARDAYVEAAKVDAGADPEGELLVGLVALQGSRPCAAAGALAKANLLEPAADAYKRLLDGASDPPCARAGLAAVAADQKTAKEALEAGQKLEDAGDLAGARAKYAAAAELDASSGDARSRLTRLADEGESLPEQARDLVEELVPWLVLALAIATLVALAFALALRMWPVRRWMARRVWKGYDGSRRIGRWRPRLFGWWLWRGVLALPRWATRVGLTVDSIEAGGDTDRATAIKKLLQAEMPKPSGGGRRTIDIVTGPLAAPSAFTDLGNAIKGLPQAKLWEALVNIISRALPRETLKLSGQLLGSKTKDTSLSLVLSRADGSAVGSVTLRAEDYFADGAVPKGDEGSDADARVRALARAGATWAAFAYLEYRAMLKPNEWRQYLGTRDWRSYALVQAGCSAGSVKAAYALFSRARNADPSNRTALFDLASAAFRMDRDEEAQGLVVAAMADDIVLAPPGRGKLRIDLLTLRIEYLRGAMAVHANCNTVHLVRVATARVKVMVVVQRVLMR